MMTQMMFGSVVGALIGDAWGATLKHMPRKLTRDDVQEAQELRGGGVFQLAPGQYTDEGEMTAALLQTITLNCGTYKVQDVAKSYREWYSSLPFDMELTTRRALSVEHSENSNLQAAMSLRASKLNVDSKSNGCLMRATPLGIVAARLSLEDTIKMVALDVRLTHPNPVCVHATTAYVIALRSLYLKPFDPMLAFQIVSEYLAIHSPEVEEWFDDVLDGHLPQAHFAKGYIKIPFSYAMYYLYHDYDYTTALEEVLLKGGDTDTNACIVGGLLGAHRGYYQLPIVMMRMLNRCNTKKGSQRRPEMYSYKRVIRNLIQLTGRQI